MAAFVPISARTWKHYKAESAALFKQGGVMMTFMSISSDLRSLYYISCKIGLRIRTLSQLSLLNQETLSTGVTVYISNDNCNEIST